MNELTNLKFSTRPNSPDAKIVSQIIKGNLYSFPEDMHGMDVIDLGAHIGVASILCASKGANVYAFEPSHENVKLLKENIDQNLADLKGKITYYPLAVGAPGIRNLDINSANTASNVLEGLENHASNVSSIIEVEVISLEEVFKKTGVENCDFLKMDIEGAEVEIVDEIANLHNKIKIIVCELHHNDTVQLYRKKLAPYFNLERMTGPENRWEYILIHK